jgi:hypothetical protein
MARGTTVSTHLTSFVGPPDKSGNPIGFGTGTKMAWGYSATVASGAIAVVGDIQKVGGTPPTGSSYSTSSGLPNTDVIKSAFLLPKAGGTPVDVTSKASITGDNQVTLAGLGSSASNCWLAVIFDEQNKMGAKN